MLRRISAIPLPLLLILLAVVCAAAQSALQSGQTDVATPQRSGGKSENGTAGTFASAAPCTQTLPVSAQASPELICEVTCDKTKPRTPIAVLIWKAAETPLVARALAARVSGQGLEVTVYKDGFEKRAFAALPSIRRNARLVLRQSETARQQRVPGLERLVVVDVVPLSDAADPNRLDRVRSTAGRFTYVAVRVEGLEPGLNYFWRAPSTTGGVRATGGAVVRCQAPVCPADFRSDVRSR
ncbi:MAG: hypothetical protein ACRD9R_06175 [Pyrinomonadaceae bacterium]